MDSQSTGNVVAIRYQRQLMARWLDRSASTRGDGTSQEDSLFPSDRQSPQYQCQKRPKTRPHRRFQPLSSDCWILGPFSVSPNSCQSSRNRALALVRRCSAASVRISSSTAISLAVSPARAFRTRASRKVGRIAARVKLIASFSTVPSAKPSCSTIGTGRPGERSRSSRDSNRNFACRLWKGNRLLRAIRKSQGARDGPLPKLLALLNTSRNVSCVSCAASSGLPIYTIRYRITRE